MASLTYLVAGSRSAGAAGMDGMALVFIIQLDSPEPSNYGSPQETGQTQHTDTSGTFQASASGTFANVLIGKANHMGKPRFEG